MTRTAPRHRHARPSGAAHRALRAGRAVTLVALGAAVVLGVLAAPAAAHGDKGVLEVLSREVEPSADAVKVTVRLTYANDGDPVESATVTVAGGLSGPGSEAAPALTPVTLEAGSVPGQYTGRVPLPGPGTWSLRVTAVEPAATVTFEEAVVGTTGSPSTGVPSSDAPTTSTAPSTTAPSTTAAGAGGNADDTDGTGATEDTAGNRTGVVVGAVVAAVVASLVAAAVSRKRAAGGVGSSGDGPDGAV